MIKAIMIVIFMGTNGLPHVNLYDYQTMKQCQEDKLKFEFFKLFANGDDVHIECKPVNYVRGPGNGIEELPNVIPFPYFFTNEG